MFFIEQVITQKSTCLASSPADRLKALADWFNDLAAAAPETLLALYRDTRLRTNAELSTHLGKLLEDDSSPINWQNYLKNGMQALSIDMDKASRPDFPINGRPSTLEGEELIKFWQETWSGFASALKAWPDIRSAATEIIQAD